jgi:hypothetical protein
MDDLPAELIRRLSKPENRTDYSNKSTTTANIDVDTLHEPCGVLEGLSHQGPEVDDERLLRHGETVRGDGVRDDDVPSPGTVTVDEDDTGATCSESELSRVDWGTSLQEDL